MNIKKIMTVGIATLAMGAMALDNVDVTDVKARQRYPWNGKIDISYTATGVTAAAMAKGLVPTIKVIAIDRSTAPWTTNVADAAALFVGPLGTEKLTDAVASADGAHQIVWDMTAQGLSFTSEDMVFEVSGEGKVPVLGGVQLWENGPYWAECNVGATKPEEYGYYFWWGDTVGFKRNAANDGWISVKDGSSFTFASGNCPTHGKNNSQLQSAGYIDSTGHLVAAHDAATAHLGAPWRMPTDAELAALISNCDTIWTTRGGVYGCLVTGRGAYASKSIFLSAAGYGTVSDLHYAGFYGLYWSSTPYSGYSYDAWLLYFDSSDFRQGYSPRYYGRSVRPLRGLAHAEAFCTGESGQMRIDLMMGTHIAEKTEVLTYSTNWVENVGADGVAVVAIDGVTISEEPGSGTVEWTPTKNGTYELTHKVMDGGVQVGETLTASFAVIERFVEPGDAFTFTPKGETESFRVEDDWVISNGVAKVGDEVSVAADGLNEPNGKYDVGGNAMFVWQDYVAGTDPTNLTSRLTSLITMEGGIPKITWTPNLGGEREYKVWGKESLVGDDWVCPTNSAHRFFKVTVEMP